MTTNSDAPQRSGAPVRPVRSFVRRAGRLTAAQARALETLGPRFVLPCTAGLIDLNAVFGRQAPRVLEIGFGDGEALLAIAARLPEVDFLGIEVHEPGVGHLLLRLEQTGIGNVRLIRRDAMEVIAQHLPAAAFAAVNVFFPDPWPKKRHHKRRLVQAPFVGQVARLQPAGGLLHLATDWQPYAEHIEEVLAASAHYRRIDAHEAATDALAWRPETRFERRGRRLGHQVRDLYYRRRG